MVPVRENASPAPQWTVIKATTDDSENEVEDELELSSEHDSLPRIKTKSHPRPAFLKGSSRGMPAGERESPSKTRTARISTGVKIPSPSLKSHVRALAADSSCSSPSFSKSATSQSAVYGSVASSIATPNDLQKATTRPSSSVKQIPLKRERSGSSGPEHNYLSIPQFRPSLTQSEKKMPITGSSRSVGKLVHKDGPHRLLFLSRKIEKDVERLPKRRRTEPVEVIVISSDENEEPQSSPLGKRKTSSTVLGKRHRTISGPVIDLTEDQSIIRPNSTAEQKLGEGGVKSPNEVIDISSDEEPKPTQSPVEPLSSTLNRTVSSVTSGLQNVHVNENSQTSHLPNVDAQLKSLSPGSRSQTFLQGMNGALFPPESPFTTPAAVMPSLVVAGDSPRYQKGLTEENIKTDDIDLPEIDDHGFMVPGSPEAENSLPLQPLGANEQEIAGKHFISSSSRVQRVFDIDILVPAQPSVPSIANGSPNNLTEGSNVGRPKVDSASSFMSASQSEEHGSLPPRSDMHGREAGDTDNHEIRKSYRAVKHMTIQTPEGTDEGSNFINIRSRSESEQADPIENGLHVDGTFTRASSSDSLDELDFLIDRRSSVTRLRSDKSMHVRAISIPHKPLPLAYSSYLCSGPYSTDVQDMVNNLPPVFQKSRHIRELFESLIVANTAEDEPNAPKLEFQNPVDNQPCPPLEFYYTNKLYHGPDVMPSNPLNLQGCSCKGRCDPTNEFCECVQRQGKIIKPLPDFEGFKGFLYNKQGRVGEFGLPIFECNAACTCSNQCMNRVVQKGRKCDVSIRKTPRKGWGVFAKQLIQTGTFIGIYSGELLGSEEAKRRSEVYDRAGTTYLFDIDFFYLPSQQRNKGNDGVTAVHTTQKRTLEQTDEHEAPIRVDDEQVSIDDTEIEALYTVDAYHAGNFTRFLNHSCDPNCVICPLYINEDDIEKPLIAIFSKRDIKPNEELCFGYFGDHDEHSNEESDSDSDVDYVRCRCGAKNCRIKLFPKKKEDK